jgi:hypothetical protein
LLYHSHSPFLRRNEKIQRLRRYYRFASSRVNCFKQTLGTRRPASIGRPTPHRQCPDWLRRPSKDEVGLRSPVPGRFHSPGRASTPVPAVALRR